MGDVDLYDSLDYILAVMTLIFTSGLLITLVGFIEKNSKILCTGLLVALLTLFSILVLINI